ncbi:hypothetical protein F0344_00070 [Streptomyces finlayi]|uniref:Transposase n=1 Tax=Streptomyces finlayi TaxID=67296 RepID=A0A7G7BD32_9ACTN|nr:hypothetical protein [Streptomyces finlayi]QNE73247.1 hypothetical protein F0344_00070 [Streptomyces finlayi]
MSTEARIGVDPLWLHRGSGQGEKRLRRQVRKPKEVRAADAEEIAQLKTGVEVLVGALHQSMTENRLLRRQLADRTGVVRTLPTQSRIGHTTHPLYPTSCPPRTADRLPRRERGRHRLSAAYGALPTPDDPASRSRSGRPR